MTIFIYMEQQQEIPVEGSLSLLAYGHKGYLLWKMKQKEVGYQNNMHIFVKKKKQTKECPQEKK